MVSLRPCSPPSKRRVAGPGTYDSYGGYFSTVVLDFETSEIVFGNGGTQKKFWRHKVAEGYTLPGPVCVWDLLQTGRLTELGTIPAVLEIV